MGKITVDIDNGLEERLRKILGEEGYRHGAMKKSIESAIRLWIEKVESLPE